MKINKNLVIDYKGVLADEFGLQPTYNNMDFYLCNEKRLRYKLNELNFDGNKFNDCFDYTTLEILKPNEWQELSKMNLEDMEKFVEDNDFDWLGDDFEDMRSYLNFVELHEPNVVFSSHVRNEDEYLDIFMHDVSEYSAREIEIFKEGLNAAR